MSFARRAYNAALFLASAAAVSVAAAFASTAIAQPYPNTVVKFIDGQRRQT